MITEKVLIRKDYQNKLVATDMGCGCCSDVDEITLDNVDHYIINLQNQIILLEEFKKENKK